MNINNPINGIMNQRSLPSVPDTLKRFTRPDATSPLATQGAQSTKGRTKPDAPSTEMQKFFPGLYNKGTAGAALREGRVATGQVDPTPDIKREIAADHERKKLYDAAVEFQSLFVKMMVNSMRKTLNKENDPLHGGQTQEIFEDMLYDQYALSMSKTGGFPLANWVYKDLTRNLPPAGTNTGPTPTMQHAGRQYDVNLPQHSPGVSTSRIQQRQTGL